MYADLGTNDSITTQTLQTARELEMNTRLVAIKGRDHKVRSELSPSGTYWLVVVSGWNFKYNAESFLQTQAEDMAVKQYIIEQHA